MNHPNGLTPEDDMASWHVDIVEGSIRASYYFHVLEGVGPRKEKGVTPRRLSVPEFVLDGHTAEEIAGTVQGLVMAGHVDGEPLRLLMLGVELGKAETMITVGEWSKR
jgi:hypothetical protein